MTHSHSHNHHDHDHDHGHHHGHHVPSRITNAFIIGIVLNSTFVLVEAVAGIITHSLSLLADAGHNLSDVASLALALLANKLAMKKANAQFSFGYRQSTVLVALINGSVLLFVLGAVAYEAAMRIMTPHEIEGGLVAIIATVGIFINGVTALLFLKDKDKDINVKGAYLHMASDALISLGVVIAGVIIIFTKWYWLDPVVSLILVVVIVIGTWKLFRESLKLSLNGVPDDIDLDAVKKYLAGLKGVTNVHDLHIWAISTTETALTAHLVIPEEKETDSLYENLKEELFHKYKISHTTIQIEHALDFHCEQNC